MTIEAGTSKLPLPAAERTSVAAPEMAAAPAPSASLATLRLKVAVPAAKVETVQIATSERQESAFVQPPVVIDVAVEAREVVVMCPAVGIRKFSLERCSWFSSFR